MLHTKLVSSLENIFLDTDPDKLSPLTELTALRGERLSCQLLLIEDELPERYRVLVDAESTCGVPTVREVVCVPVVYPVFPGRTDDNYLSDKPGLYPDLLRPLHYGNAISVLRGQTRALWITLDVPQEATPGQHSLTLHLTAEAIDTAAPERQTYTVTLPLTLLPATLPEQTLLLTQWFHCDCLASYYHVPVFSDRHFEIIEAYAALAVRNGINMLLTPVLTPPLDTAPGGERLTTQLVGIVREGGSYRFDYTLLDRWIDMCDRVGIRYLEISHLYTQWGAGHAPKVIATVDGVEQRLFGWETAATGEEYRTFLRALLPSLLAHLRERGDDRRCFFHISDEPGAEHMESYQAAKEQIADLLAGYPIMDALSDYSFWTQGAVELPIPASDHIQPFLDGGVPGLWTYYCCGQCIGVSNRLIAMPSYRNRSIGMQLYKYNIVGFLQWGYNFYNDRHSVDAINPYSDLSGEYWVPAGDTFSVYPAQDGTALESLRIAVFYEALQDMRAMQLCEQLYDHEAVVAAMEQALGKPIVFSECAHSSDELLRVRAAVNRLIADHFHAR